MNRNKRILALGSAVVIALLAVTFFMADTLTSTTNAADGGPEMSLTVKDGGTCEGSTCTVAPGADFTLTVEIVTAPAQGYILAQSYIVFGADLTYTPSALALDEFSWPECTPASLPVRGQLDDESVLSGCLTGILVRPVSNYAGNFLNYAMTCSSGTSSTEVQLLEAGHPDALTNGALFKDENDLEIVAKVSNITVNCGAGAPPETNTPTGPTDTPGPTATTGPSATPTETPEATDTPVPPDQLCGDVDLNETVNSVDSLQILFVVAALTTLDSLDAPENADVGTASSSGNPDGEVTSVDSTFILQHTAGLLGEPLTC